MGLGEAAQDMMTETVCEDGCLCLCHGIEELARALGKPVLLNACPLCTDMTDEERRERLRELGVVD
jgi:hypothetical protein